MNALGFHYLLEFYECDSDILKNAEFLENIMQKAVQKSGAVEIGRAFHRFSPQGVSGVILISESHFSIHTWPEYGYAALDLFTCSKDTKISDAYHFLATELQSQRHNITEIRRGIGLRP
ncbi:MAG: adenosylmethionine decarboxylase [Promethearchaeota archaeon]